MKVSINDFDERSSRRERRSDRRNDKMTATLTRSDTVDRVERPDLDKQGAPARTTRTVLNPSRVSAGDLMVPAATIQADESLWQAAQRLKVGPHRPSHSPRVADCPWE